MKARARRQTRDMHVLRYVPVDSPVHRLWAGTKLLSVVALSVVTWLRPTWPTIGLVGASETQITGGLQAGDKVHEASTTSTGATGASTPAGGLGGGFGGGGGGGGRGGGGLGGG